MFKVTPNPPVLDPDSITNPTSPYESLDSKKLNEAAERALDHYLGPPIAPIAAQINATPYTPNGLYMANPQSETEALLTDACESLGSVSVMLGDFSGLLDGTQRKTLQGIAQIVMVAEMAVNQVLDKLVPTE